MNTQTLSFFDQIKADLSTLGDDSKRLGVAVSRTAALSTTLTVRTAAVTFEAANLGLDCAVENVTVEKLSSLFDFMDDTPLALEHDKKAHR